MKDNTTRRDFIKKAAVSGLGLTFGSIGFSAKSYANIVGSNERVNIAVVGTNSRGAGLAKILANQKDTTVRYICDVHDNALAKGLEIVSKAGGNATGIKDYRKLLEKKDLDAVVLATPDHWHAYGTVLGCQAGKHVYVEKPCSHNPREGELSIEAARKYNRIVQVGSQRRSWPVIQQAMKELHDGSIGNIHLVKGWYTNNRKSIGKGKQVAVPAELDFDLWQGPAPRRPYQDNLIHYNWHWFWHWGTGEALNNGTHEMDLIRWGLDLDYPTAVSSEGGRFWFDDDWETPDTQIIDIRFGDKCLVTWEGRSCSGRDTEGKDRGVIFYGENGALETGANDYKIYDNKNKLVKTVGSSDVVVDGRDTASPNAGMDQSHLENFLNAIRGKTKITVDIAELHKSTLLVQLGNIAWRVGRRLNIDPSNGHILNDPEAKKLWSREYEPGWELKV